MALNSSNVWGEDVAAEILATISSVGIKAGTKITNQQLIEVWRAVKRIDFEQLTVNAEVTSNGQTEVHVQGGNAPIINLDGDIS